MAIVVDGVTYDELAADPSTPAEGRTWYNTTSNEFKIRSSGVNEVIVFRTELVLHTSDTTNPHTINIIIIIIVLMYH